jgi:hypothetical protein
LPLKLGGGAWFCFLLALLLSALPDLDTASERLAAASSASVGFLLKAGGGRLDGRLVYEFGIVVKAPTP